MSSRWGEKSACHCCNAEQNIPFHSLSITRLGMLTSWSRKVKIPVKNSCPGTAHVLQPQSQEYNHEGFYLYEVLGKIWWMKSEFLKIIMYTVYFAQ